MLSSVTYGSDLNFSEESLVTMHNSELADILGNLVHRVLTLCGKYCNGVIPDNTQHDPKLPLPFDLSALKEGVRLDMEDSCINAALFKAMDAARATNRFLTEAEPWKMKGSDENRRAPIVRTVLEAVYAFTHFLAPVIPIAAQEVFNKLNSPPVSIFNLRDDFFNLRPGTIVTLGDILFQKIDIIIDDQKTSSSSNNNNSTIPSKNNKKSVPPVDESDVHVIDFTKVDIRVGQIVKIWNHETSDRLYCEEIDVGNGDIRQIASGIKSFYSSDVLLGRKVLVVCNLKESKFQGFMSYGMILAAKSEDGQLVELVDPPIGSLVGERVFITPNQSLPEPFNSSKMKKMKVWESLISPFLKTNNDGVLCWKDFEVSTSIGYCSVKSLVQAAVS